MQGSARAMEGRNNWINQSCLAFYSSLQQIRLNVMAYISLVIASRLKILLFVCILLLRVFTQRTHILLFPISYARKSLLHEVN